MKTQLSLPKHPNIIFLIIVFDIFSLVAVYGIYSTNWVGEAGIPVKLTTQEAQNFPLSDKHLVVKVFAAPADQCIVGRTSVPYAELTSELSVAKDLQGIDQVLLMIDKDASVQREREVISAVKSLDLSCILVAAAEESNAEETD